MKKVSFLAMFLCCIYIFYIFFDINYRKQKEIQKNIIEQPNSIPKTTYAQLTAFGFQNIKADFYWLSMIQYIGANALGSEYKPYLYNMTNLITDLNPYYESPYVITELLLPNYNYRYETLDTKTREKYIKQGISIGKKAVQNFCNSEKIKDILQEDNLQKLFTDKKYKNPCREGYAIYNLAYIYFYYKKEPARAAEYYKIAAVSPGSPEGAKTMIAIMQAKAGVREKSFFMFLNMARYVEENNNICEVVAKELETIGKGVFGNKVPLDKYLIQNLEKMRKKVFYFDAETGLSDTKCDTFIQKSIRELHAYYLDKANKKYFEKIGKNSKDAKELFDSGFIDYIPVDFQQYEDYGIIYIFNPETQSYDFKLGKYEE